MTTESDIPHEGAPDVDRPKERSPNLKSYKEVIVENTALHVWFWATALFLGITLVQLALEWKTGEAWENFLRDFATSPAAAGCAAILAAAIAARSFGKGLKHTQSEASYARMKEREDSWWEKFEWVTNRIIPKDPKAEKLALPLALTLLLSLTEMATGKFQRDAAEGIKQHYLETAPTTDESNESPPRDLAAEVESLRAFRNAAAHSERVQGAVSAQIYDREATRALVEAWEDNSFELDILPVLHFDNWRPPEGQGSFRPDAVLHVGQRKIIIEFKAWDTVALPRISNTVSRWTPVLGREGYSDLVIITSALVEHSREVRRSQEMIRGLHFIHWLPEHGVDTLRSRLEDTLGPARH